MFSLIKGLTSKMGISSQRDREYRWIHLMTSCRVGDRCISSKVAYSALLLGSKSRITSLTFPLPSVSALFRALLGTHSLSLVFRELNQEQRGPKQLMLVGSMNDIVGKIGIVIDFLVDTDVSMSPIPLKAITVSRSKLPSVYRREGHT